ncbi:MAG: VCBS repeat-containing protein [Opitutaceae bacterium]
MIPLCRLKRVLAAGLAGWVTLNLVSAPASAPTSGNDMVALAGPDVVKLDWNTRALTPVDIDGDGLTDLAVVNNDRAAVELLLQIKPGAPPPPVGRKVTTSRWEPVLEDARFRKVRVTTGITVLDLVVADLNHDGRPDLAYTGDPQNLTVRYQQPDGDWSEKKINDAPLPLAFVGSLRVADLDGDGRLDLVMLGQKELAVFFQDSTGEMLPPEKVALSDEGAYGMEIVDADGDGRPDLLHLSSGSRDGVRIRLQTAPRQFGPEQAFPLKPARSTLQVLTRADARTPALFAYAQDQTGHIGFFSLIKRLPDPDRPLAELRPRVFTPRINVKAAAAYVLGDFDGDGAPDVVVSDPDGAQGLLYRRLKDGGFTAAERFPSLSDARSLAAGDWDGDGRAELFVASTKEQVVGVAAFAADGRFSYPQPIPSTGRPLGLATGAILGDGALWLAVLKDEGGKRAVDLWTRRSGQPERVQSVPVTGTKTDPKGVRLVDVDQDGRLDLVVFTALESLRVWLQTDPDADGKPQFRDVSSAPAFRKGLVDNLESAALTLADVNGDGRAELLIGRSGFARALRLGSDGQLTVLDQYNARDAAGEISTAFAIPARKGQAPWVVLYDRKGERLEVLKPDAKRVYQVVDTLPVGKIDVVGTEVRVDAATGRSEVFIFGKDRFWWLPLGQPGLAVQDEESYATDLPEIGFSDVIAGEFTGDRRLDLACVDPQQNVLEILSRDDSGAWQSRLHFQVFETDDHASQRKGSPLEPRETIIADVTGDGRNDLVLLVHDRILVYPAK